MCGVLLIEPVWNRNLTADVLAEEGKLTFNRTSMESKHGVASKTRSYRRVFNRISMESKGVVLSDRTDAARVCGYFVVWIEKRGEVRGKHPSKNTSPTCFNFLKANNQ